MNTRVVIGLSLAFLGLSYGLRVYFVMRFRLDLLKKNKPEDPKFWEKMETFDSISFETMLFKFWRPLKSFYKGTILEE